MTLKNWRRVCGKAIIPVEREWLRDIAAEAEDDFGKDTVIVNIGIFRGASMYCMRAGAPNARLVGVDIVKPDPKYVDSSMRAEIIVADSGKCHADFEGPVHLLFVDGDHSYEGVKADIAGWTPKVAPGGVVAFHDFKTEPKVEKKHAGIKKAVLEWEREDGWHLLPPVGSIRAYRRPGA